MDDGTTTDVTATTDEIEGQPAHRPATLNWVDSRPRRTGRRVPVATML